MKRALLILAGICCFMQIFSQASWDTTKYIKYNDRLVIALFTSWRQFDLTFDQQNNDQDSGKAVHHYLADANSVTGVEIGYDKFSFSLGFKTSPDNVELKGRTTYKNFNLGIGGNKWIMEGSFRNYRGFYDQNTAKYDTSYRSGSPYFQMPSLGVKQIKGKFMYFTNNKKFSYKAGYGYTYRQLKSAFTWVLGGNIYSSKITADTSFFPLQTRGYYLADDSLRRLNVIGVSAGGGAGFNLVIWKRLFANVLFCLYAEPQWRTYGRINGPGNRLCYISAAGDARISLAYNGDNFFFSFNSFNDFTALNSGAMKLSSKFISGSLSIGYRFKVKTPKFYQKFQETKIYKLF